MSFKSFLTKYAAEMLTIGKALDAVSTVATGDKSDIAKIRDAGDVAKSAARNIMETIDDVQDLAKMEIGKDELIDIVKELVPLAISEFMEAANERAAAKMKKAKPTQSAEEILKPKKAPAKKAVK